MTHACLVAINFAITSKNFKIAGFVQFFYSNGFFTGSFEGFACFFLQTNLRQKNLQ